MEGAVTALLDSLRWVHALENDVRLATPSSDHTITEQTRSACVGPKAVKAGQSLNSRDLISARVQGVRRVCLTKAMASFLTAPSQPYQESTSGSPIAVYANDCRNKSNARCFSVRSVRSDRTSPVDGLRAQPRIR